MPADAVAPCQAQLYAVQPRPVLRHRGGTGRALRAQQGRQVGRQKEGRRQGQEVGLTDLPCPAVISIIQAWH